MASDSLFYEIFQESPQDFFELIGTVQPFADLYSMDSQEVKQTWFQIDIAGIWEHKSDGKSDAGLQDYSI
jgi:predicted transposase YdaD